MRAVFFALALLLGTAAAARAQDEAFAVRLGDLWGATPAELAERLGDRLERLPMRWDFGPYYADHQLSGIGIAGEPFAGYLQMDRKTHRLRQILLERRQGDVTPRSTERIIGGLLGSLGEPDRQRIDGDPRLPESAEFVWLRGDTVITAGLFDFRTTEVFREDPNRARDPIAPFAERQRNNPRLVPRRLVIRFTPAEGDDLAGRD